MRKIKFRAWDGNNNLMWQVIDISFDKSFEVDYIRGRYESDADTIGISRGAVPERFKKVILMQYTGLKDKNDTEIYEGDIVKILYTDWPSCDGCHSTTEEHMNDLALTRVVIWSVQGFYVSHKVDGYAESMEPGQHGFIEVIGNIYENPELMK